MSTSIGGGKSSKKSVQTTSSPAANKLASLAEGFATETAGTRGGLLQAMEEVLSTGGSTIPIISRSVEASRQGSSRALSDLDDRLALQGLAGTPFGENIRAGTKQEGEIAAGRTQQSLAQMIFQLIPSFVLGQSQTALSGLAGAIPGMTATRGKSSETFVGSGKSADAGDVLALFGAA